MQPEGLRYTQETEMFCYDMWMFAFTKDTMLTFSVRTQALYSYSSYQNSQFLNPLCGSTWTMLQGQTQILDFSRSSLCNLEQQMSQLFFLFFFLYRLSRLHMSLLCLDVRDNHEKVQMLCSPEQSRTCDFIDKGSSLSHLLFLIRL